MEVYVLDDLFRRTQVLDRFESLIWTERFKAYGDFELKLHSSRENRIRFPAGSRLAINDSHRVMTVETVEDVTDSEGRDILTLKGRSLEQILEDRLAREALSDLFEDPKWILTGTPTVVMRKIFHDICVLGLLDPADVIPLVIEDSIFPPGTIAEPTETISYEIDPMPVYQALQELAELYDLGFRLVRNFDTTELYFDVYAGNDRTTGQSTLPPVIFSPDLDNLRNTSELTSIASYKSVAYVISPAGHEIVYPSDVVLPNEGFDRRVLYVKADDINDADPGIASERMIQRGKEALSKNRRFTAFDGEIDQRSKYKYGIDYLLGDIVELRNSNGFTNNMRVTEQIFVSDREGDRSYPTLEINSFVTPGTWLSWDYNQVWADVGPGEYWSNQP